MKTRIAILPKPVDYGRSLNIKSGLPKQKVNNVNIFKGILSGAEINAMGSPSN